MAKAKKPAAYKAKHRTTAKSAGTGRTALVRSSKRPGARDAVKTVKAVKTAAAERDALAVRTGLTVWMAGAVPERVRVALAQLVTPTTPKLSFVWHVPADMVEQYETAKSWPPFLNVDLDASQWRFNLPGMGFASIKRLCDDGAALIVYTES